MCFVLCFVKAAVQNHPMLLSLSKRRINSFFSYLKKFLFKKKKKKAVAYQFLLSDMLPHLNPLQH